LQRERGRINNSRSTLDPSLLRALRIVVRADSDPVRQALFANLLRSRRGVRFVYGLHERIRTTWASALLVSCYGLSAFLTIAPSRNRRAKVLVVANHENAKRQVSRVVSWVGPDDCGWLLTGKKAFPAAINRAGLFSLLSRRHLIRTVRIVRTIDQRHGFLVSCRAAGAIAWYARSKAILDADKPGAVLVSSDSNPEEVGFVGAARALEIPQVFVAHAYPTPLSPPLDFSLSILEGEAAVVARKRKGPIKGEVLFAGIEGRSAPLDPQRFRRPNPSIGVFTPKGISWPALAAVIEDCRRHFHPARIVIRWHPSMLEPPRLADLLLDRAGIVETPKTMTLPEVARECDWVIGDENSNVHLPVLKLGIPTVAVKGLGLYPPSRADMYGFVANGIVFPPVQSIRDVDPDTFVAFFSELWAARFRQYDFSYLRPQDAIAGDVRRAVWGLLDNTGSRAVGAN